ncbi:NIL domain-containing protein [Candidatus Omnitrophota bacterium]
MVSKRIVLHFPQKLVDQPIVYKLIKDYSLEFNILKASITPEEEGLLVLELKGQDKDYNGGVGYLKEVGVKVEPLSRDVKRNETRCTDCSVCVPICPTDALIVDQETRKVEFHNEKCIACELCIKVCPVRAMEVHF